MPDEESACRKKPGTWGWAEENVQDDELIPRSFKQEPCASLGLIYPCLQQAGCCDISGVTAQIVH